MNTPNENELPLEQETPQLRARITQLEEVISRLRASSEAGEIELQYKEVFDNVSVCMFLIDVTSDGRFKFGRFNPAEEKAVGLSNAEVSGKFVEEVFADELASKLSANYRRCLKAGTPITYDDELHLPGGRRNFHSNLIPMRNASGRIHRIVGACIDTTEFKRTQEEAFARQKLESLGVLAAGIAHDFNNLLGGILSCAELALTERAEGSAAEEELQRIKTASIRGAEIVRELMIYGGEESGAFEPVDISALVHEMLELLKISISKNAILQIEMGQDLPPIYANPAQIRRVVMNLVTNASEAFEKRSGAIHVTTGPGKGSTFDLYLPRSDAPQLGMADDKTPLPRGNGEHILLVEDEQALMLLAEEMLAALNYEPSGFTRTADALSEFRADPFRFDAVFLDYLMPGITGIELARNLHAARSDIPIVMISGYTGPALAREAVAVGVGQILTKPLDFRQLAEAMAKALNHAQH